jgi:beta-N-acetylhexosaminidase
MSDVSRLLMIDFSGTTLEPQVATHLEKYRPGGVILFRKNITSTIQVRKLVDDLKTILGPELLIAIDQEGGGVWRTPQLPAPPSGMSLGAADDLETAFAIGATVARGMRTMGLNWNFAPILDLNNNPRNPVISDRSFGENPQRVTALALEWAKGLMSEGVAACGKHFPGHGDTFLDSHLHLPTVSRNLEGLEEYELVPFRGLVPALPSLMTAHIVYPTIDPDLPATLSKKILTGLLRERGGYEGVIVTDSMGMKAIDDNYGRGDAAVMSINAGADMVEALGSIESQVQTFEAIEVAAVSGKISSKTIETACERLHKLATNFPAIPLNFNDRLEIADRARIVDAWTQGITSVGNVQLPKPGSRIVLIAPDEVPEDNVSEVGVPGKDLAKLLSSVYKVTPILYPVHAPETVTDRVCQAREAGEIIIFATTSRYRLRDNARALADLAQADLHLALWNAYTVNDVTRSSPSDPSPPGAGVGSRSPSGADVGPRNGELVPAILTYGCRAEALEALLRVLRGDAQATGRLPVKLS